MQPLTHLGAAVVDQHGAVLVDEYERAGLVEERLVERDPELDRSDRQAALDVRVALVEGSDLEAASVECGALQDFGPDGRHPLGVLHHLRVRSGLARAVEVATSQFDGINSERRRTRAEHILDQENPLRPTEATEGGLRGLVRLGDAAVHLYRGDPVRVVDVAERA